MARTAAPRGPYQTGIRRRREIIEAAARVFAEFGYVGGSLRQIAADVGVTPAALTRHFGSKEELLEAVTLYWDEETTHLSPQYEGLDCFLCLPALLMHHLAHRGLSELFLMLAAEASSEHHPARRFISERYTKVVADGVTALDSAIERGQVLPMPPKRVVAEVRSVYAMMDGIQLQWLVDASIDLIGDFASGLATIMSQWTGTRIEWHDETSSWLFSEPIDGLELADGLPATA